MDTLNTQQKALHLNAELKNFTETETWYRHPLFGKFLYTDGVQYLAKEAGAYWLIDLIFGFQHDQANLKNEEFQTWDLSIEENQTATLTCGDGNDNILFTHRLDYTDFPLDKIRLFFSYNVLLLPSEW
jgi:hypothetical protein